MEKKKELIELEAKKRGLIRKSTYLGVSPKDLVLIGEGYKEYKCIIMESKGVLNENNKSN